MVRITKMIQGGNNGYDVSEVPDTHDRSFSDDWLPSWKLLQASLISEYRLKLKGKEELVAQKVNKDKIPIAMGGFKGEVQCYACGGAHKKGDPSCKAGPYDVHSCAPVEFKHKQEEKKREFGGKGKGKGKGSKVAMATGSLKRKVKVQKLNIATPLILARVPVAMERSAIFHTIQREMVPTKILDSILRKRNWYHQ